jgi:P27 family predicted phage terminase small subunit
MGSRGPFPVPWSSETARGRNTFQTPTPAPVVDIQPPASLDADALRFWEATAPSLIAAGRFHPSMAAAFGILCELASDCDRLSREVATEGDVVPSPRGVKANPKVRLLRDARRDFLQYSKAFGLDPASSARLPTSLAEEPEPDLLEEYIRSRGA